MATNPIERLALKELQSAFDKETLEMVDDLVAGFDEGPEPKLPVSVDKQRLASIYAYANIDRIARPSLRKRILATLDQDELIEIAKKVNPEARFMDWDSLVSAIVNAPWIREGLAVAFVEAIGLPNEVLPISTAIDMVPGKDIVEPSDRPFFWPLDYQHIAHEDVLQSFQSPGSRVLLQLPTGAGKTYTALNIATSFAEKRLAVGEPCRIIWLAHARELLLQANDAMERIWPHRGSTTMERHLAWDGKGFPEDPADLSITFATLQTAHKRIQKGTRFDADLIILDEAHVALAPTFSAAVRTLEGHNCRTLGLTATPGRGALSNEDNERLADFFGQRMVGIATRRSGSPIAELQNRRILSRIAWEPLRTEVELELDEKEIQFLKDRGDFSESFLKKLGENFLRNRIILEKLEELIDGGKRILYFAPSVNQSKAISTALRIRGRHALHIDGATPKAARQAAIKQFRNGTCPILCNYGVLSTGFDAPSTDCVVIARPTTSLVEYSQMVGRGLRGPLLGGSPRCAVVQIMDVFAALPTDVEELYRAFDEYWSR